MSESQVEFGDPASAADGQWRAADSLAGDDRPMADFAGRRREEPSTSTSWLEDVAWLNRALRLAFRPRALLFAVLGWMAVTVGWRIGGSVFVELLSPAADSHLAGTIVELGRWPWSERPPLAGWQQVDLSTPRGLLWWWQETPLVQGHLRLAAPFVGLFDPRNTIGEFCFLLVCGLWELVVWSFFGALITRLAAVEMASGKSLSWSNLFGYARRRFSLYFAAPLFGLGGGACLALPLALAGLLLRTDAGAVILAAGWVLPLLAGLIMAEVLVGLFFGFPLMWATISAEGTDAFDALSRSFAYTYQRPVSYFLYSVAAGALGILGWAVVAVFICVIVNLAAWGVNLGSGNAIAPEALAGVPWSGLLVDAAGAGPTGVSATSFHGELALRLVRFWVNLALAVSMAFVFSYFWTVTTAIYFLLRRQADGIEIDKVYMPGKRDRPAPAVGRDVTEDLVTDNTTAIEQNGAVGQSAHSVQKS